MARRYVLPEIEMGIGFEGPSDLELAESIDFDPTPELGTPFGDALYDEEDEY